MGHNFEAEEYSDQSGDPDPERQEVISSSLLPIEREAAQQAFAEIAQGADLRHVFMRQKPSIEDLENGASDFFTDVGTDILILLGYRDDLRYRSTTDQGAQAYLRAIELMAQKRGVEVPVFDTPVLDIYDNGLLGLDSNLHELIREQVISDQEHKRKSELTRGVEPEEGRVHVRFVDNKRFFLDAAAMRQRYPALKRGFDAIYERDKAYVEAYRKSPLYVDEVHERAFLIPASILHPMVQIKEELASFQHSFGEQV